MEFIRKILETETNKLLAKIPALIPPETRRVAGPLANSLKMTMRLMPGGPKSELKGVEWLFDVLGMAAPGIIATLTETQLRAAALKALDLGVLILENLPPEGDGKNEAGNDVQ